MIAERLDRALRAAGIPIVGVSIGTEADRRTWVVTYDKTVTAQDRAAGDALVASFDPTSPVAVAADKAAAAATAITPTLRAFFLFWFRQTNGRDPSQKEKDEATAALIQAFKDVS